MHAIVAALAVDDLDRALDAGLLTTIACPACSRPCRERLLAARDSRIRALSARERFRARQIRLQQRAARAAMRNPASPSAAGTTGPSPKPALPAAAAAALARAKARAAQRGNH